MGKVKIGMIGAGTQAMKVHYPSLAEFEDVEIVAVSELDAQRRARAAAQFHIRDTFKDYKEMLADVKLDAVYIIMRPHLLLDIVLYALEQKKHIFIEKPPGISADQTRQMAQAAQETGALTMVAFNRRFIPVMVEAKRQVEERGPIFLAVAGFYKNMAGRSPYWPEVDVLTADAIHCVDTLRWMGGEVKEVKSITARHHSDWTNTFNALIEFESGSIGILKTHYGAGARIHTFEMHSIGISALINPDVEALIYRDGQGQPDVLDTSELAGSGEYYKYYGFYAENRYFIDCIKQGRQPMTNFADGLLTMELVDWIRTGKRPS
jgi:virulence factor